MSSILTDVKKVLGIGEDYTAFDLDIMMHINSAFGTLNQLGIGPDMGFAIEDDTPVWDDFLGGDLRYNPVKTYIYLRTRLLFDPPATSYAIEAFQKQVLELEWRLNIIRENDMGYTPTPPVSHHIDVTPLGGHDYTFSGSDITLISGHDYSFSGDNVISLGGHDYTITD